MVHNENDRVFTVSKKGASRMNFNFEWEYKEAPKRGLRNPWNYRPDRIINRKEILVDGHHIGWEIQNKDASEEEMSAWKIERDEYMRQRDEWIALQMFHEYGYETFLEECNKYSKVREDYWKTVFPCESRNESQCNIYCPIFNNCAMKRGDE